MKTILAIFVSASLFAAPTPPEKPTIAILGGGIGALTSALYLSRAGFEPIVIEGECPGGAITQTHQIQNWPGEIEIDGLSLTDKIHKQVESNGARFINEEVVAVDFSGKPLRLTLRTLDSERKTHTLTVDACIIAMGSKPHTLNVPGEAAPDGYWGRGVSTCAICDGALYRNKIVGIAGGGDSAVIEAVYLANLAKEVHLFVRKDTFRAKEKKRLEQLLSLPNMRVHYQTQIQKIEGDGDKLTHIVVQSPASQETFALDGLFLALGSEPNTAIFKEQLQLDAQGYIVLTKDQQTSVDGVYAIGDIVDPIYKQAISAAGDGCKAALQLQQFLADTDTLRSKPTRIQAAKKIQQPSAIVEITTKAELEEQLKEGLPVVIDFYATWCNPCKLVAPLFEHSAISLKGQVKFVKVNVDRAEALCREYQVQSMPTAVVVSPSGKVTERRIGSSQIAMLLNKLEGQKQ